MQTKQPSCNETQREITEQDLPLRCPLPNEKVWNAHPAVYLPIEAEPNQQISCPYCGTLFRLKPTPPILEPTPEPKIETPTIQRKQTKNASSSKAKRTPKKSNKSSLGKTPRKVSTPKGK